MLKQNSFNEIFHSRLAALLTNIKQNLPRCRPSNIELNESQRLVNFKTNKRAGFSYKSDSTVTCKSLIVCGFLSSEQVREDLLSFQW